MLLFGGVFLALIIGSALVVLSEWLDQSLRDPIDAQRALGLPVMAVLPEAGMLRYGVTNNRLPGSTATRWLRGGLRELPGTGRRRRRQRGIRRERRRRERRQEGSQRALLTRGLPRATVDRGGRELNHEFPVTHHAVDRISGQIPSWG